MTTIEIILAGLVVLALVEVAFVFAGLISTTRDLRALHKAIEAAQSSIPSLRDFIPFPAVWRVDEKAGPLMLCEPHLEQHDQERGASFTPLQPAPAGSRCAACLREAAILKARTA
jgi:hypothetical protein